LNWNYVSPKDIFNEMKLVMPSLQNISWERLERDGFVTYPVQSDNELGKEILFDDGFPTINKRAQIIPTTLIMPNEELDHNYPLILSTGRLLEHWHTGSMTRRSVNLDKLEPEPIILISSYDLKKFNINTNKKIIVETRRGKIKIKPRLDNDLLPGMLFLPFCFKEAAANILTNATLDPIGKIPELKFSAARISKS
jgi:formate dehydrogenase major subunit